MISDPARRWLIFLIACLLFLLSQFYRASVAVIAPDLIRDLGMDTRGLSLISAAFFYAFALMQIPISMFLDGIGPRVSMAALSLIAVIGAILFAMGHSLSALVAGRMLIGIGMACNLMGTLKLITLWFTPLHFATLSALVSSIGTVGNLIAATPLVLLVQAVGWRNSFLVIAGINMVLTLLFYIITRDRPESSVSRDVPKAASTPYPGNTDQPPSTVRGKGLLDHFTGYVLPLWNFCSGPVPLGRPVSDQCNRRFCCICRQSAFINEHGYGGRQSGLRLAFRCGIEKPQGHYCFRIDCHGSGSGIANKIVIRYLDDAALHSLFWFWIYQQFRRNYVCPY
jgi:MFS family permease